MKKVIVASENKVKIDAAREAFTAMFPKEKFKFVGVKAKSGVSDQPRGDKETIRGATNRANDAMKQMPGAVFYVAFEGGVIMYDGKMGMNAWAVVKNKNGKIGQARTAFLFLPNEIVEHIIQGKELADADSIVFRRINSKEKNGTVGFLTKDVITRTKYYREAMILALIPFCNPELHFGE